MLKRQITNSLAILTIDSLILLMALYLGDFLVYMIHGVPVSLKYSLLLLPIWGAGAWLTGQFPGWGLGGIEEFRRIELQLIAVFSGAAVASLLIHGLPSRIAFFISYFFCAAFLPLGRVTMRNLLRRMKCWGCPVVLYGGQEHIAQMIGVLKAEFAIGYDPCGLFGDELPADGLGGVPVLGQLKEATDEVGVALISVAELRGRGLVDFVDQTLAGYQKVILIPDMDERMFSWVVPRNFNGLVGLELNRNLLTPFAAWFKRMYELVLVLVLMPVWLPLILILSLIVYVADRCNPFYMQERVGQHGRRFNALKLRTMVPDADVVLQEVLDKDLRQRAEWEAYHKLKNDPRITPIGRFLRRFSLDELPQLLNVLKGDMALVGPRPLPLYHDEKLSHESRLLRNKVRPGITGQWQVSGRSDCGLDEMEQWDKFYVRNWSIWMDLYILARTLRVVFLGSGAY